MDPDAALAEGRKALAEFRNARSVEAATEAAVSLADSFAALDEWMSKAGFMPFDWMKGRKA